MKESDEQKKIAQYYDNRAKKSGYVEAAGQWKDEKQIPLICEEICDKIELKSKDRVLELGCGNGVLGNWIQKKCQFYIGLDISFFMLKKFLSFNNEKNFNLMQATTHTVPFKDDSFDIVVINGVTMYLHDSEILKKTLSEIERVVSKNGTIFIGENIIPAGFYGELVWFQNLPKLGQIIARPYVKIRKWLAIKNPKFAGKWKLIHSEISPEFLKKYFKDRAEITQSKAAAYTIRERILGEKYKGNRRADFIIKFH